jgi:hypothetical protein
MRRRFLFLFETKWATILASMSSVFGQRITLRLAIYRQTVCLGDKPLETHDQ